MVVPMPTLRTAVLLSALVIAASISPAQSAPEILPASQSADFVDPSVDFMILPFSFMGFGSDLGVGLQQPYAAAIIGPDGAAMHVLVHNGTAGVEDYSCGRGIKVYLDGTPASSSAEISSFSTFSEGEHPANGTWTVQFPVPPASNGIPPLTSSVAAFGRQYCLSVGVKTLTTGVCRAQPAYNNPQIWNRHMTSDAFNDPENLNTGDGCTGTRLVDAAIQAEEYPVFSRFFAPEGTIEDDDGDGVPDHREDDLCAQENPNFNFDGACVDDDYGPPTLEGILEDVQKILEG